MSEEKKCGFIRGNRLTFYVGLPVVFVIYHISSTGWQETDYLGLIVSLIVVLIVMTGLDWLVVKWEIWLDKKLADRKLRKKN